MSTAFVLSVVGKKRAIAAARLFKNTPGLRANMSCYDTAGHKKKFQSPTSTDYDIIIIIY